MKLSATIQRILVGLILLVHVGLVARQFPASMFLADELPVRGDMTRYFMTSAAVRNSGSLIGYDYSFMAGAPVGLWNSVGKKGYELFAWATPFLSIERAMYLSAVLPAIAGPLLAALFLWLFISSRRERLMAVALLLLIWHFDTRTRYFWQFGNSFFPFAAVLILPFAIALNRALSGGDKRWYIALCILPAVIIYLHPSLLPAVFVAALISAGSLILLNRKSVSRLACCLGAASVSLLLLLPWLLALWHARADYSPLTYADYNSSIKHLIMDVANDRIYSRHFDRNVFLQITFLFGAFGWWHLRKTDKDGYASHSSLFLSGFGVLVFSYAGCLGSITSSLQSYRMQVPGLLLLVPLAARGMSMAADVIKQSGARVRWLALILMACIAPRLGGAIIDATSEFLPLNMGRDKSAAISAVQTLAPEGRVLCDDIYLSHLLPKYTGTSVIGDGFGFTTHCFAGFDNGGNLFGRPASVWVTNGMFGAYMNTYAVQYALLFEDSWKSIAETDVNMELIDRIGAYSLYRMTNYEASSLSSGACAVVIRPEGIECRNIKKKEFILKMHMPMSAEAGEGAKISPVQLLDDPVPFIRVTTDGSDASIKFAGARGDK